MLNYVWSQVSKFYKIARHGTNYYVDGSILLRTKTRAGSATTSGTRVEKRVKWHKMIGNVRTTFGRSPDNFQKSSENARKSSVIPWNLPNFSLVPCRVSLLPVLFLLSIRWRHQFLHIILYSPIRAAVILLLSYSDQIWAMQNVLGNVQSQVSFP